MLAKHQICVILRNFTELGFLFGSTVGQGQDFKKDKLNVSYFMFKNIAVYWSECIEAIEYKMNIV